MTTIEVTFTCDKCDVKKQKDIRVHTHFTLGSDTIPDGWVVVPGPGVLRCFCPEHANEK